MVRGPAPTPVWTKIATSTSICLWDATWITTMWCARPAVLRDIKSRATACIAIRRRSTGQPALLYHNNRDGTFTEVCRLAGVANPAVKTLGVAIGDIDGDGWPRYLRGQRWGPQFSLPQQRQRHLRRLSLPTAAGVGFDMDGKALGLRHGCRDRGILDGDGLPDILPLRPFRANTTRSTATSESWLFEDGTAKARLTNQREDTRLRCQGLRLR